MPDELRALREETIALLKELPGVPSCLTVRAGDCSVEVAFPDGAPQPAPSVEKDPTPDDELLAITAPLVGTYYAAPAPGSEPFVKVGDHVEPGQNVAIVEAMKLMNHVTAEWPGEVVEVPVGDGEPVEFGQPLVLIRPSPG
ncbi:acetyl-CoA carboxylase biotin carboxyl carrier protein [Amycolatopsis thailandensis]|uniref:acetyl-CoA carboxylase biotin carboxyl carrier protein n=1 Tax=Amycolatopsis thailandensis TaxID=589330 RepID=UPI00378F55AF